jgi:argininosuccinate lyase
LAGSSLGLDPEAVAADLGFSTSVENSIDGTASRDFAAEFAFVTAMVAVDISRMAEEVVLWATKEFSFVTLRRRLLDRVEHHAAEEEPRRRRAGPRQGRPPHRGPGRSAATLKALPLAYNRDLQEDKEPVFDAVDTLDVLLPAFAGMVDTMSSTPKRVESLAPQGFSLATDIAEWLVRQGVPFRVAHEVAGACVRDCEERGIELWDLTDDDLCGSAEHLTPGVREVLSVEGSLASRNAKGGTAPARVRDSSCPSRLSSAPAVNGLLPGPPSADHGLSGAPSATELLRAGRAGGCARPARLHALPRRRHRADHRDRGVCR